MFLHDVSAAKVYDGSKGTLTFAFGNTYRSVLPALENVTSYNFTGNISIPVSAIGATGYLTQDDLIKYKTAGWEILSHSMTHLKIDNTTPNSVLQYEIVQSKISLNNMGLCVTGYESPYDVITTNSSVFIKNNYKYAVINPNKQNTAYFITHDGAKWNFPISIHYYGVGNGLAIHDFATAKVVMDYAINNHTYLILNFHQIDSTTNIYATPPSVFWQILQYAKLKSDAGQLLVETSPQALGISCMSNLSVISSPAGNATYSSPQSVTLTASAPSIIYYTTDGSTPTSSSTSGPSPITEIAITTNSTLKFFAKDNVGNLSPISSTKYSFSVSAVTPMNDTTSSYGLSTNAIRQIQAEYVSSTSSLVGKSIDSMTVKLQRTGAPSGTVQVGVFNTDLSDKQIFGTINAPSIATSYTPYSFSLPIPQTYQIQSGDRIGIKFTGGNATNFIAIMTDQSNSFDGVNSYLTYYTNTWQSITGADLYMTLKSHQ